MDIWVLGGLRISGAEEVTVTCIEAFNLWQSKRALTRRACGRIGC